MMPLTSPTDEELTRRAQVGETGALGLLLARHQAPMRAVAMSLLGYGPDAEDVVQDAALTALRRIGDVRDPAAVGPWLRAVVRNAARMRLRVARETPGLEGLDHLHPCDQSRRTRSGSSSSTRCGTGSGTRWRNCPSSCGWC
ncbi:RNA polymerase sigma factor [Streptomyces mirabilis]|uniref:RNA polymerase sigma factor n=1 Tax=Streptomyces mirabilis TaxID=68239 RepID=UPI0037199607